ncbi:uncharacterized protein LOC129985186 [Argiope bruennichi]|uniref:uncharacterized protein LOC129985186 n=1 Tax=Argiope bruennichi TaxID=94029 RepID=UPI0024955D83|nr:uncharacterized protein LOC129985186 [Argiope bruennichi]
MEVLILLFCFMIEGSAASMCDQITCDNAPLKELSKRNYTLNETQLTRLCPPTLELFNCYSKFARDCFEMELEELAASNDPYAKVIATKVLQAKNLVIEMCDEHSTLRKEKQCIQSLAWPNSWRGRVVKLREEHS